LRDNGAQEILDFAAGLFARDLNVILMGCFYQIVGHSALHDFKQRGTSFLQSKQRWIRASAGLSEAQAEPTPAGPTTDIA
jgi:hypothetical protein